MESIYQLGNVKIKLNGNKSIFAFLHNEFKSIRINSDKDYDIEFKLVDKLPPLENYVSFPPVLVTHDYYQSKHGGLTYQVKSENGKLKVTMEVDKLSIKERMRPKVRDWNYLSSYEQIAKNFMYDIFDYLSQIVNLGRGQSYLHASSMEKNGRGLAIIAWGGIGKTTSMLKLVTEDNWKFLSDDLGVIDENGLLYRSPKKLQVYAYNLEGQPNLKKLLLSNRNPMDLFAWQLHLKLKGIKRVRRRVSAESLLGSNNVGISVKLTDALFIERSSDNLFHSESISIHELARRAASTLLSEMEPLGKMASAIYSSEFSPILPTINDFYDKTYEVLLKSFSGINPILVKIPLNAGPNELVQYLRKLLN